MLIVFQLKTWTAQISQINLARRTTCNAKQKFAYPTLTRFCVQWNVAPLLGEFGGRVGIYRFLQSFPIPRMFPSLFFCRDFFSFCPFNCVNACVQAQGTAMSAGTWVKCKKEKKFPLHLNKFLVSGV